MKHCVLLVLAFAVSGCNGALNDIGAGPTMTAVGHSGSNYVGVDPRLSRLSVPPRTIHPPKYAKGSLWNSGPTSLFGDRRARSLGDILTSPTVIS